MIAAPWRRSSASAAGSISALVGRLRGPRRLRCAPCRIVPQRSDAGAVTTLRCAPADNRYLHPFPPSRAGPSRTVKQRGARFRPRRANVRVLPIVSRHPARLPLPEDPGRKSAVFEGTPPVHSRGLAVGGGGSATWPTDF